MIRHLLIMLALAALVSGLAPAVRAAPLPGPLARMPDAPIHYRLAIEPEARRLVVTAVFPAVDEPAIELTIATNHNSQKDFCDNVRGLVALALDGTPLRVTRPRSRRWLVRTDGQPFSLSYAVVSEKDTFVGDAAIDEVFHPTVFADRSLLWGTSWLVKPSSGALKRLAVLATVDAPAGQPVRTTWQQGMPLPSVDALSRTLTLAGSYRYYEGELSGHPVTFALTGSRWKFSDQAFVERVLAICRTQEAMMGFYPTERLIVTLEEGTEAVSGGNAVDGAISLFPRPSDDLDDHDALVPRLIAHEHFHLWNGRFTAEDPTLPQGPLKWFTEGFTSYYGAMTLLCDGTLSPSGFVRVMNAEIARYYANPAAHRARLTSTDGYFERPEIKELAYNKGMLLAWLMDLRIRHLAPGRSLGDFMKAVMVFSARGETFDAAKLRRTAEALTGTSWRDFFARYVAGREDLPFVAIGREAGLPMDVGRQKWPALADDARTRAAIARLALPAAAAPRATSGR